ncbi:hypothetical protein D9613_009955 [Agrocybe pediades]|uniref:WW domain-containing protein n=1 Tax=Agrocybe pediades TaxID=84607 RepID=A0A8H4QW80_9AGAR|nr:hypothetical protein D9613_009955 [Agrocybe pediades]
MSSNTRIPPLLRCLLPFLLQRMKMLCLHTVTSALKAIALLLSKLGIRYKATADVYKKPAPKADDLDMATLRAESDSNMPYESVLPAISMTDVAFSLYPYPGGIPNASQTSTNLQASRSAHNSRVSLASGSLSSVADLNGNFSNSQGSSSNVRINVRRPTIQATGDYVGHDSVQTDADHNTIQIEAVVVESPQDLRPPEPLFSNRPYSVTSRSSHPSTLPSISSRSPSPQPLGGIQEQVEDPHLFLLADRLDRRELVPVMPMSSKRYDDKPRIQDQIKKVTLPALERSYDKPKPPGNWTRCVHPEGARYFVREGRTIQKVWTESDIFRQNILTQLEAHLTIIEDFISEVGLPIRPQWNLVINYYVDGNSAYTGYYFVDHEMHKVFFLDDYDSVDLDAWGQAPGAESECHIGHEIEAQYWYFILLYPHALNVEKRHVQKLRGIILHFIGDSTTSSTSNAPYSLDELYRVLSLIDHVSENVDTNDEGTASILGRLMFVISRERFLNFHGEAHSRLQRTFSVYGTAIYAQKWLVKSISPLLFYAPDFHLRTLQNMGVDGVTHKSVFQDLMQKMNDEWEQFILFGTVMLNANVAFLAIQSVDNNDSDDPHRLPAQVLSYLSVVASVGSILLGLLLVREFKTKDRESVDEIQAYFASRHRHALGLGSEVLAILFSLPYALLMWGMLAFLAAFASLCFKTSGLSTRIIVGSAFLMVACLMALCIRTNWDKRVPPQPHPLPPEDSSDDPDDSQSMFESVKDSIQLQILSLRQTRSSQSTAVNPELNA